MEDHEKADASSAKNADLSALRINRPKEEKIKTHKWLKIIPWILIPALAVVAYFILLDYLKQGVTVDTTTVRLIKGSSAKATLSASGYVVAQRQSAVASKATGRLTFLGVEEGDEVLEGQIIAEVENDDVSANLELARANLEYAIADSIDATTKYILNQELHKAGSVTDIEIESYRAMYLKSLATLAARRAQVKSAQINVDNTYITAPFKGKVITKMAEIGDIVAPMASSASSRGAVAVIADMSSLEVEADVSESNIQKVKMNQPCEITLDAYPEIQYSGFVKNIVPTANRASATIMTRIAFNKLDSLIYPEMSARVYFLSPDEEPVVSEEPAFLGVSKTAVITEDDQSYVFIIEDDIVEKRNVTVGKDVGRTLEILEGLEEGDELVLTPPGSLESGDKIKRSE